MANSRRNPVVLSLLLAMACIGAIVSAEDVPTFSWDQLGKVRKLPVPLGRYTDPLTPLPHDCRVRAYVGVYGMWKPVNEQFGPAKHGMRTKSFEYCAFVAARSHWPDGPWQPLADRQAMNSEEWWVFKPVAPKCEVRIKIVDEMARLGKVVVSNFRSGAKVATLNLDFGHQTVKETIEVKWSQAPAWRIVGYTRWGEPYFELLATNGSPDAYWYSVAPANGQGNDEWLTWPDLSTAPYNIRFAKPKSNSVRIERKKEFVNDSSKNQNMSAPSEINFVKKQIIWDTYADSLRSASWNPVNRNLAKPPSDLLKPLITEDLEPSLEPVQLLPFTKGKIIWDADIRGRAYQVVAGPIKAKWYGLTKQGIVYCQDVTRANTIVDYQPLYQTISLKAVVKGSAEGETPQKATYTIERLSNWVERPLNGALDDYHRIVEGTNGSAEASLPKGWHWKVTCTLGLPYADTKAASLRATTARYFRTPHESGSIVFPVDLKLLLCLQADITAVAQPNGGTRTDRSISLLQVFKNGKWANYGSCMAQKAGNERYYAKFGPVEPGTYRILRDKAIGPIFEVKPGTVQEIAWQ